MAQAQTSARTTSDETTLSRAITLMRADQAALVLVIVIFAALGALYAVKTPAWENPDEPAHFNYVRQIAETGTLPELKQGDYNQDYLEKIKAARFPPGMPIDSIRYESYQPPLYYLTAVPVYLAARMAGIDRVVALRLYSVLLSLVILLLAYRILIIVTTPARLLALAAVALMAFIPMNVAMSAAVNADPLAELLVAVILLICFARLRGSLTDRAFILFGGVAFGLALLTSTKIYAAGALLVLAELVHSRQALGHSIVRVLVPLFALSILVSGWWFARNALLYGGVDIFGWARHDQVVIGQPTTAEWIARYGAKNVIADFFIISFKSFWAQFGWMGVLVNDRIYVALFLFTLLASLGAVLWLARMLRERSRAFIAFRPEWALLGAWLGITLLAFVYYNFRFIQPQGRYLFPALIPIAGLGATGIYEVLDKRYAPFIFALISLALVGLDVVSLFWFIIPQLTI